MLALDLSHQTSVRLSRQERIALCNDISRFSLLLGREAESPGDAIGASADAASPVLSSPWERLHLIAALWPRLEATLHAIATSPESDAVPEPRSLPIHAVRGDPATLARLARQPADHRAWIQSTYPTASEAPARLREQRATHTVQTPANRIATRFLKDLLHETQALHRLAHFCDETTAALTAEKLFQSARGWLRQSPFSECISVPEGGKTLATEPLLRCAPAYRSLYTIIRTARSGLHIDWSESAILRFPVLEAWHLYEIWCFLKVGFALQTLGWRPVESDCLQIVQAGMRLRLAHGQASRLRFRAPGSPATADDLHLFYQPLFASANQASRTPVSGYRSLSHAMQPDIALKRAGRLLLLDPKYRPYNDSGDEQEDVDKMHTYRDAIVRSDRQTGRIVPAVDAAWCLFPGTSASDPSERLRAYPASTQEQPFGKAGVGAVQVRPAALTTELAGLIQAWLQETS